MSQGFKKKQQVCEEAVAFLCSDVCEVEMEKRSHYILELLLHQVVLHTSTGRYKGAITVLQVMNHCLAGNAVHVIQLP